MNAKFLIVGVAAIALAASGAQAKSRHHATRHAKGAAEESGGAYAAPAQPIPYGQLDAYMKATPKERADMMSGGASAPASTTPPS
jgi:hypothetical protein